MPDVIERQGIQIELLKDFDPFVFDDTFKYDIFSDIRVTPENAWDSAQWLIRKSMLKGDSKLRYLPEHTAMGIEVRIVLWAMLEYFYKTDNKDITKSDLKLICENHEFKYKKLILPVIKERVEQKRVTKLANQASTKLADFLRSSQLVEAEIKDMANMMMQRRVNILGKKHDKHLNFCVELIVGVFIDAEYIPSRSIKVYKTEDYTNTTRKKSTRVDLLRPKPALFSLMKLVVEKGYLF